MSDFFEPEYYYDGLGVPAGTHAYLVQIRLVRLPEHGAAADWWSSAESTMTVAEASVPFETADDPPTLAGTGAYLSAVSRAVGRLHGFDLRQE